MQRNLSQGNPEPPAGGGVQQWLGGPHRRFCRDEARQARSLSERMSKIPLRFPDPETRGPKGKAGSHWTSTQCACLPPGKLPVSQFYQAPAPAFSPHGLKAQPSLGLPALSSCSLLCQPVPCVCLSGCLLPRPRPRPRPILTLTRSFTDCSDLSVHHLSGRGWAGPSNTVDHGNACMLSQSPEVLFNLKKAHSGRLRG